MPVSTIQHKDKQIVLIDYTSCESKEEMIRTLREAADLFRTFPDKVLSLSDFSGAFGSKEFMAETKRLSVDIFRSKTKKAAAIGVTGIKKVLLASFNAFSVNKLTPFDTKEEALEYLTKED